MEVDWVINIKYFIIKKSKKKKSENDGSEDY